MLVPPAETAYRLQETLRTFDSKGAGTYIVDAGTYYFALGRDAHDALNNILAAKGKTEADGMTATEVGNSIGVTCQKASAILRQMVEAGTVEKVKAGKVVRFVAVD